MRTLATWNVLHRIHAENWKERCALEWPEETRRVEAIAACVNDQLAQGCDAVCLQEVSGDQLVELRARLRPSARLFDFRYPRLPHLRHRVRLIEPLADPSEHLVMVLGPALAATSERLGARAFATDAGKGFLGVQVEPGFLMVCVHLTFKKARLQLAEVLSEVQTWAPESSVALVGDFNADATLLGEALGPGWTFAAPPAGLSTQGAAGRPNIDHVVVRLARVQDACVVELRPTDGIVRTLSDHRWLQTRVEPLVFAEGA